MKNLITAAFAFKEGYMTSIQLNKTADDATKEMYLKNIFVSLSSAKLKNPEDDVILSINCELSPEWKKRFEKVGVGVRVMDFTDFVLPETFQWSLAFFKLNVLSKWVEENSYERILMVDADTYSNLSCKDLWKEADRGIVLYPLGHTYSHSDRDIIRRDFERLYPSEAKTLPITHYGGEFVCGNVKFLSRYVSCMKECFEKIKEGDFKVEKLIGDESLLSICAALLNKEIPVICATPYMFRFWTEDFYLVSTVTESNPVSIWHLPAEKDKGFIRMYKYFVKHGSYPDVETAARYFGIVQCKRPFNLITLSNKINGKLNSWKKKK